jgi:hypothetical protein
VIEVVEGTAFALTASTTWPPWTTFAFPLKCSDPVGLFQPMSTVRRGDTVREAGPEGVEWVVDALEGRGEVGATERNAGLLALVSSHRMSNLASRQRRDLQAEGVVISEMGTASSGRVYRRDASAPTRSEVRARAGGCAAAGVDFICLAEAGSR